MRQFDVCPNPSPRSRVAAPFIVVLQSHLLDVMPTVVVAPLLIEDGRSAYAEASVRLQFQGADYVLSAAEMVAIDARHVQKAAGSLADREDAIRRAIERVFTGF